MARKEVRKCICCTKKYDYCPSCGSDRLKPTWMSDFCSESCMKLWTIATKFNMKTINKDEAKAEIKALNLVDTTKYVDCIKKDLKNIMKEDVVIQKPAVTENAQLDKYKKSNKKSYEVVKKEEESKVL